MAEERLWARALRWAALWYLEDEARALVEPSALLARRREAVDEVVELDAECWVPPRSRRHLAWERCSLDLLGLEDMSSGERRFCPLEVECWVALRRRQWRALVD